MCNPATAYVAITSHIASQRMPVKKAKTSASSGVASSSSNAKTNDDGDSYWDIGNKKRATVRVFRGVVYVDFREFYEKDGKMLPGKKGKCKLRLQNFQLCF